MKALITKWWFWLILIVVFIVVYAATIHQSKKTA